MRGEAERRKKNLRQAGKKYANFFLYSEGILRYNSSIIMYREER